MNTDLISVVIPCYNSEQTISRAVLSVANQSYKNIEIICIDDGSKDNTVHRLHQLNTSIENMFILTNDQNKGPSYSRNRGVKKAKGKYIAFLDADDYWHKDKLKFQVIEMNRLKINFISAQKEIHLLEEPIEYGEITSKRISFNQLLFKNHFVTSTVLMEKRLFVPFDENQRYSEDYKSWLQTTLNPKARCAVLTSPALCGAIKPSYGVSGLSANLWQMEKFELKNYWGLLKQGHLLALLSIPLSLLKYLRRLCVTHLKK